MKRDNKLGPALLAGGKLPQPRHLALAALGEWMEQPGGAILDLRADRVAFAANHLKGSLFAPPAGGRLSVVAGSYLEETSRILLVVEDSSQVDDAVRQLVRIGLDRVDAWILAPEALSQTDWTASYSRIAASALPAGATVLDVRGADEFAASHVRGAKNIAHTRLAARLDEVPAGAPLHVHCASGLRAAMACAYLASLGREVIHVDGTYGEIPQALKL
jgi:hydroxyacylglutathione hydrolase